MILEGIVTTLNSDDSLNIAPMGAEVGATMERFVLRPYPTSQTYRNLKAHGEGVLHVTDDVLLLAQAAVGRIDSQPKAVPAQKVRGVVLTEACRYYEFRVQALDEREPRMRIEVETVHNGWLRDFFGFNRAKHAVVEAAILATRLALLPRAEIEAEFARLETIVQKTGVDQEKRAFTVLKHIIHTEGSHTISTPPSLR